MIKIKPFCIYILASIISIGTAKSQDIKLDGKATISGTLNDPNIRKIYVVTDKKVLGKRYDEIFGQDTLETNVVKNEFTITNIKLSSPAYISLLAETVDGNKSYVFHNFICYPNDQIKITVNGKNLVFSGNGATKYSFLFNEENRKYLDGYPKKPWKKTDTVTWLNIDTTLSHIYSFYKIGLERLDGIKSQLSDSELQRLKLELICKYKLTALSTIDGPTSKFYQFKPDILLYQLLLRNEEQRQKSLDRLVVFDPNQLLLSENYLTYILNKLSFDSKIEGEFVFEYQDKAQDWEAAFRSLCKTILSSSLDQHLKDKLITKLAISYFKKFNPDQMFEILQFVIATVKSDEYSIVLKSLENRLKPVIKGAKVIDYTFIDTAGNRVKLDQFRGKVVLVDLWFTGCGACITVAKAMPEVEKEFKNKNVVFLSLSIDADKATWLNSIDPKGKKNEQFHYASEYYSDSNTIYWNLNSTGYKFSANANDAEFIKTYVPENGYPTLLIISKDGKFYMKNPPRPDYGGANALASVIKDALTEK